MKLLESLKSKNRIPFIMFLVVLINYIPLIRNNIGTKLPFGVETKEMGICFVIEIFILSLFLIRKIKITKKTIFNFVLLLITTVILYIIQYNNYRLGNYKILDIINIASIFLNILFLYVFVLELKVDEKYIYSFFRAIVFMGIVACIINIYLYEEEIINLFKKETSWSYNIKSFFGHRNQFAMFMYISIIANIILILRYRRNIFYKLVLLVFLANLIFTSSRTGILCTGIFLTLFFITTDRLSIMKKIIIIILGIEILLGTTYYIINRYPEIEYVVQNTFIRNDSIKTVTGRTYLWELGIDLIFQNNINKFFGVGRFRGIESIEIWKQNQFHSFYIEALAIGGIMELVYFMFLYLIVIIKIILSDLEKKYKSVYISMYISYFIYCAFESLSRFSIGCADTLCMIFFITIPLLHASSIKDKIIDKKYEIPKEFLLNDKNIIFGVNNRKEEIEKEK